MKKPKEEELLGLGDLVCLLINETEADKDRSPMHKKAESVQWALNEWGWKHPATRPKKKKVRR